MCKKNTLQNIKFISECTTHSLQRNYATNTLQNVQQTLHLCGTEISSKRNNFGNKRHGAHRI
jgi:hypothetical protein